jgi:hypothetical protein
MDVELWPNASYFNSGTARARQIMTELELIDRKQWFELYRRRANGTLWRLDADDKYQQRFLICVDGVQDWWLYDARQLQEELLLERRGGLGAERCIWQGCSKRVLHGSAFCLQHTYDQGVRK